MDINAWEMGFSERAFLKLLLHEIAAVTKKELELVYLFCLRIFHMYSI